MDSILDHQMHPMSEDGVEQMLVLAQRLRESNGGELDESAIQAVAEATGAPLEYVRLAVMLRAEKEKLSLMGKLRTQFLALGSDTRRYLGGGISAAICAILSVIGSKVDQVTQFVNGSSYAVFGMLALLVFGFSLYNSGSARNVKAACITGGIFGGGYYLISATFSMFLQVKQNFGEIALVPYTVIGALAGFVMYQILDKNRSRWGLKDPVKDRQDLLRQLVDLQEQLRSGEQSVTFLSIDIVGSTRMKEMADSLAVEFTFNEYHAFVERLTRKHGGRIHSTAGDGIICAFDNPATAFAAAKNIQAELIELNTLRNKIGVPIVLREGIHSGHVVAPDAGDLTSVNFAHEIDMAAHIQKVCPPGGIAVSEVAAMGLAGGLNDVGSGRSNVMGTEVAIWLPKPRPTPVGARPAIPDGA